MANIDFKQHYKTVIVPEIMKECGHSSIMATARLEKIVLNIGLGGKAITDKNIVKKAQDDLTNIAGQLAVQTETKKSVAGFKIRDGWPIGVKTTLRDDKMYEFLKKLVNLVLPRVRDFRGYSKKSFDGRGNFSIGISEYIAFPEVDYETVTHMLGMDITIVTSTNNDEEAYLLLKKFFFPFVD